MPFKAYFIALIIGWLVMITAANSANALINLDNRTYVDSWIDEPDQLIERRYSSSLFDYDGVFGKGWCSFFADRVYFDRQGNLELRKCTGVGGKFFPQTDNTYRGDRNNRFMITQTTNGFVFEESIHDDTVIGGITPEKFDTSGRVVQLTVRGRLITVQWDGANPSEIQIGAHAYKVIAGPNGKIHQILDGTVPVATYTYFLDQTLESVKDFWGNVYYYRYDSKNRLAQIQFPDKTLRKIRYDDDGFVTDFIERTELDGTTCSEHYQDYVRDMVATTEVIRKCTDGKKSRIANRMLHQLTFRYDDISRKKIEYLFRDWRRSTGTLIERRPSADATTPSSSKKVTEAEAEAIFFGASEPTAPFDRSAATAKP